MSKKPVVDSPAPEVIVTASTLVLDADKRPVNQPPAVAYEAPKGDVLTFSMYLTIRGIPAQRQAGMRAFTSVQQATLIEWDAIFRRY
jgi:hypothetical protein